MTNKLKANQDLIVISVIFGEALTILTRLKETIFRISPGTWQCKEGAFCFNDCFIGYPPPGGAHKVKLLAFTSRPDSYALFTANLEDGWVSLAYILSESLKTKALTLGFCSDNVTYPARFFNVLNDGKLIRHVSVRLDNKWQYYEKGAILPKENASNYTKRLIKARLTNENLIDLADKFGISLGNLAELSGKGILLAQT